MNRLEVANIYKNYGTKVVLNDISFSIKENEIFGLIGLNGIGKTTLIKTILNLIDADKGDVSVCQQNINKGPKYRENISYLPEKFQPSLFLKPMEFFKIFANSNNKATLENIHKLCDLINLDKNVLNKKMSSFSKGMVQKVGLIGAVLEEKQLMILDEPMSGLDPQARIYLKNMLLNYKNNGKSIFFSSHVLSDIDEICDRIAILHNSKLLFIGTPQVFKDKHKENSLEKAFLKEII